MAHFHLSAKMSLLTLGDRIADANGARGTIRYVGPIATSKSPTTQYYGTRLCLCLCSTGRLSLRLRSCRHRMGRLGPWAA